MTKIVLFMQISFNQLYGKNGFLLVKVNSWKMTLNFSSPLCDKKKLNHLSKSVTKKVLSLRNMPMFLLIGSQTLQICTPKWHKKISSTGKSIGLLKTQKT